MISTIIKKMILLSSILLSYIAHHTVLVKNMYMNIVQLYMQEKKMMKQEGKEAGFSYPL